ncbi:DUF4412 domain-containing protein [Spongiivirga citrea]|uniref:DUF4412 domain-containing protein n=1 Tax=Spongiivirga citrea TaxID=1481457 RepID=A0A6M0CSJ4_9FLAO|nr:DUF4412 domain-containing protein [Spongiivirga citrea]NER19064.1 DUF4412 domain-containing protein [Spongiivirga citrea]
MKTTTTNLIILLIVAFLGGFQTTEAQFFKKLKERAKQAAEEAVMQKTEEIAAEKIGKGMDKLFDFDFSKSSMDPAILPETYEFEWKYTLKMQAKQGTFNMVYYLKPDATYFASRAVMPKKSMAGNVLMVHDIGLNVMTMFMEASGSKAGHIISLSNDDEFDIEELEAETEIQDYTFKKIGTKEILGYECQGFLMENDDMKMTMYVAMDAPVSFNQVYGGQPKKMPKGFDPKWLEKADSSIVMEMNMVNKKKKKFSAKMTCIALENTPTTINVSEYEFMKLPTMQE